MEFSPHPLEPGGRVETTQLSMTEHPDGLRDYSFSTTMAQRDNRPRERSVREDGEHPRLRSGSTFFDGLFALAVDDLRLNSVEAIRDGSYNEGSPIEISAFQTGEKWTYVWTRDLAYAADLGLSVMDPDRVVESLLFKTSPFRPSVPLPRGLPEDSLQVIQDTGSGGSWPVSTDRVSWALGAESALRNLRAKERERFAGQVLKILTGTLEADRLAAYDAEMGLYGGEQSFLDWRQQTYAPWIFDNLAWMSASFALSTNAVHYHALDLLSRLYRERGKRVLAARYEAWAQDLKERINEVFWLEEEGLYSSLTSPAPDAFALHKFDLLGTSLVILLGIAPEERAIRTLENYPLAPFGPPVYFPQQPDRFVYHNRGIWPFVTAYGMRAGRKVGHAAFVEHAVDSLVRGAALNLSNMENFEWLTGKPFFESGPAINSRRQLWSVAGYLNMVIETLFGFQAGDGEFRIRPFMTPVIRGYLGEADRAILEGLRYQGHELAIELQLPEGSGRGGIYGVEEIRLNGRAIKGAISLNQLQKKASNRIVVHFGERMEGNEAVRMIPEVHPLDLENPDVFSPRCPMLEADRNGAEITLHLFDPGNPPEAVDYEIFRDGERVARLRTKGAWTDPVPLPKGMSRSYAAVAVFRESGNRSHPSRPLMVEREASDWIPVTGSRVEATPRAIPANYDFDRSVLPDWGRNGASLRISGIEIEEDGRYSVSIEYNNHAHAINSGITNAVKRAVLDSGDGGSREGIVQMPNIERRGFDHPFRFSTPWVVDLEAGTYEFSLGDFFNMSYLEANAGYADAGGVSGPLNTAHISGIRITRLPERSCSSISGKEE